MNTPRFRDIWLPVLLAAALIILDLAADRMPGTRHALDVSHLALGALVVVGSFGLMRWAVRKQKAVEAVLRQSHDELERRVQERTAELARANAALRAEIEESRKAGEQIRHLSSFPELNPNPVLEVDSGGSITFCNAAARQAVSKLVAGSDPSLFVPADLAAILQDKSRFPEMDLYREVQAGSALFAEKIHLLPESGRARIYAEDITARRQAEAALQASEETYRLLFQNMAEGFALYELLYDEQNRAVDWRILEVNDAYTLHTGIARERIVGRRISELYPAAISEYLPRFAQVVATQTPVQFETHATAVDRYQRVITFPAGGRRFASTVLDISDRKHAQAELQRQAAILSQLNDAVIVLDTDRRVAFWNAGAERMYGYRAAEVAGRTADEFPLPAYIGITRDEMLRHLLQDKEVTVESIRLTKDGRQLWVETRARLLRDERGEPSGSIWVDRDITDRKDAEEALSRAAAELSASAQARAAMEERQRLARELHDSVSQVFYGISLGVHTALATLDTDQGQARDALDFTLAQVGVGLTEMRALIFELRPELLEQEGLAAALKAHAKSIRTRHGIRVELSLCEEPELSPEAKEALFRVALEALQNAVRHARADLLELRLTCQADGYGLDVRDNGVGFDTATPFPGHFGLHTMQERVALIGGALTISSTPDNGTHVHAFVPLSATASQVGG